MLRIINQKYERENTDTSRAKYNLNGKLLLPEEVAIKHYENLGYSIIWGENDYWATILSLLFWDVIFAKVRGSVTVSRSGYQDELDPSYDNDFNQHFDSFIKMNGMPSDMFTGDFARNREDLIKARYRQLRNIDINSELSKAFSKHKGKNCRLINDWNKFTIEALQKPISGFEKETLLRILLRLIGDISTYRSGFPDLIGVKDTKVIFVEVKSEKDKLSENQIDWITYLALDRGIDVEIFLINHTDKKEQSIRKTFLILLEPIKIEIGKTTSKLRDEMIERFKKQIDYKDGDNPSASFSIYEDDIKEVVKTVGRWKTSKFFIEDTEYSIEQLRNSVYEYHDRKYFDLNNLYFGSYDIEDYGCSKFDMTYVNDMGWKDYGYIDPETGDWIFDKDKIKTKVEEELDAHVLCPYIHTNKIKKDFLKLPERVNPKDNSKWSYVDNNRSKWIYHNKKWITNYSDKPFQGIQSVVGVKKITPHQKKEIISSNKRYSEYSNYDSDIAVTVSSGKKSSGGGCLGVFIFIVVLVLFI